RRATRCRAPRGRSPGPTLRSSVEPTADARPRAARLPARGDSSTPTSAAGGQRMNWGLIIIIAVVVVLVVFVIGIYNGLVQRRLRIDEAFAQIEVQLKRRHDLIPNLVNAVKGYMGFEQKVLTDVTNARANAVAAGAQGPAAQAQAENAPTGTLRSLFGVVENYPELKANQNVLELQEQLSTTENQIAFSRQHYNATVL